MPGSSSLLLDWKLVKTVVCCSLSANASYQKHGGGGAGFLEVICSMKTSTYRHMGLTAENADTRCCFSVALAELSQHAVCTRHCRDSKTEGAHIPYSSRLPAATGREAIALYYTKSWRNKHARMGERVTRSTTRLGRRAAGSASRYQARF
jgi:hypothetical protein